MNKDAFKMPEKKPAWVVKRGHQPHKSGSGVHQDRRMRRLRTRGSARRRALGDGE